MATSPLAVATTLSGPRKSLDVYRFDSILARTQSDEYSHWLKVERGLKELKEREHVQPFFQLRTELCALTGMIWGHLTNPDRFTFELDLGGAYRPDFVVGCSSSKRVLLVEFENGDAKSLFERANDKDTREIRPKLGRRMLGGMAQIADWVYFLESASSTLRKQWFTFEPKSMSSLLVVGRDHYFDKVTGHDESRYAWLQDRFAIGSMPVVVRTFDGLQEDLENRLLTYS